MMMNSNVTLEMLYLCLLAHKQVSFVKNIGKILLTTMFEICSLLVSAGLVYLFAVAPSGGQEGKVAPHFSFGLFFQFVQIRREIFLQR